MVTFWQPGNEADYRTGFITNLSITGVFVATEAPMAPLTTVDLRFILGEDRFDILGEVVRTLGETQFVRRGAPSGMGVRFEDPTHEAVQALLAYRAT